MSRWGDMGTWEGSELRREVFFFPSGGVPLFGSIYAPASAQAPSLGLVICNSWGFEANQAGRIVHSISIEMARAGGVAFNFHYPGFGDSQGNLETATIGVLAGAAIDALREAARRYPDTRWILAGLMLGGSVAALAAAQGTGMEGLLLVQPALRPGPYFARLERASKRSLGGPVPEPAPGFAYGYPLTPAILDSAPAADAAVEAGLLGFKGEGAIVRHEKPTKLDGLPQRFEEFLAPGAHRFAAKDDPALVGSTVAWLRRRLEAEG